VLVHVKATEGWIRIFYYDQLAKNLIFSCTICLS